MSDVHAAGVFLRLEYDCSIEGFRDFLLTDGKSFYPYEWQGILFIPQISSKLVKFPWGIITICLHPQYMNESVYLDLKQFCHGQQNDVVGVQYAIDYRRRMNPVQKVSDGLVRKAYFVLQKLRKT